MNYHCRISIVSFIVLPFLIWTNAAIAGGWALGKGETLDEAADNAREDALDFGKCVGSAQLLREGNSKDTFLRLVDSPQRPKGEIWIEAYYSNAAGSCSGGSKMTPEEHEAWKESYRESEEWRESYGWKVEHTRSTVDRITLVGALAAGIAVFAAPISFFTRRARAVEKGVKRPS